MEIQFIYCRLYSNELDTTPDFPAIYRQETNKLTDEELLKLLSEYRKPDKFSKFTVIPGSLKIKIEPLKDLPESMMKIAVKMNRSVRIVLFLFSYADALTTALVPLRPFPVPPTAEPTIELTEFEGTSEKDVHPYTTFLNHLYVYPQCLNFDTQKMFTRARNIACVVEVRDSDAEGAKSLQVFIEYLVL